MSQPELDKSLRVRRVLWLGLLTAPLQFALVLAFVTLEDQPTPAMPLVPVLGALAAGLAVASFVVGGKLRRDGLIGLGLRVGERVGQGHLFGEGKVRARAFHDASDAMARAVPVCQRALIVELALCEAIAVLGVAGAVLTHDYVLAAPFFAASMLLTGLRFPREGDVRRALESAYDADLV